MQKKIMRRIVASLVLSVMLFAMPVLALVANTSGTVTAFAEDIVSGNGTDENKESGEDIKNTDNNIDSGNSDDSGNTDKPTEDPSDNGDENDKDKGSGTEGEATGEGTSDSETTKEPECICEGKCSQYEYNKNCPVCSKDYRNCTCEDPSVKITIYSPSGWYSRGTSAKVSFKVEDILNTGKFAIKSVKAKIGQNGTYQDVTEDMFVEITEDCSVYVLATDAHDRSYERSRSIKCFDTAKPTLNAAVSEGLLIIQASDTESGVKVVYVNGYEFDDVTNGTVNIRLSQFDAGYEYFTITAMDEAGNVSEVYKTKNPYYKDPESDDDSDPAEGLPVSSEATDSSSATATVTEHTKTDSDGNTVSQTTKTSDTTQKTDDSGSSDLTDMSQISEMIEKLSDYEMPETTGGSAQQSYGEYTEEIYDEEYDELKESGIAEKNRDMNLGKEFYTIEAASGKVFYLIIDRDGEDEMVYFLTEITENDLLNVTSDNSETLPRNSAALESQIPIKESALPNNNNKDYEETHEVETPVEEPEEPEPVEETDGEEQVEEEPAKSNPLVGYIIMAVLGAGVIGTAYYFKVVKKKQDGDFVEDEDEDEEDFEVEKDETESEDDFFSSNSEAETTVEQVREDLTSQDVADTIDDEVE